MKRIISKLRLLNYNEEVLCKITAILEYDENDEEELYFLHPLNGNKCQNINQCFYGWSEQEDRDNYWSKLREEIQNDNMLIQKIYDDIEEIDYYI